MIKHHQRAADLVWFDPGETTGVCVLSIDPAWLNGAGAADWEGFRRALKQRWFAQIGTEPKLWEDGHARRQGIVSNLPPALFNGVALEEFYRRSGISDFELNQIFEAREILDLWPSAAWGYEDYVPESMAAAQKGALTPMRFFSTLAFTTIMDDQRPRVPFVQNRTMKSSASDDRMRLAGLYLPGMPHATDAARHAAVFARAARQKQAVRAAAWPRLFDPARQDQQRRNVS
jgi:hypothetical protein